MATMSKGFVNAKRISAASLVYLLYNRLKGRKWSASKEFASVYLSVPFSHRWCNLALNQ